MGSVYLGGFTWTQLARALRVEEVVSRTTARTDAIFRMEIAPGCPEIFCCAFEPTPRPMR